MKQVQAHRIYPEPLASFNLVARRLLNPWIVSQGGLVSLAGSRLVAVRFAGALATMFLYFVVTVPDSTWALFSKYSWFQLVSESARPTYGFLGTIRVGFATEGSGNLRELSVLLLTSRYLFEFLYVWFLLWFITVQGRPQVTRLYEYLGATGDKWRRMLLNLVGRCTLAVLPLALLVLWPSGVTPASTLLSTMLVMAYFAIGWLSYQTSRWYGELLVDRVTNVAEDGRVPSVSPLDVVPKWGFAAFALLSVLNGLLRFGDARLSVFAIDAFLIVLLMLAIGGLDVLANRLGAERIPKQEDRERFRWIGRWHKIVQVLVPFLLVLYGGWLAIMLTIGTVATGGYILNKFVQTVRQEDLDNLAEIAGKIFWVWIAVGAVALSVGIASCAFGDGAEPVTFARMFLLAPLLGALLAAFGLGGIYSL